MYIYPTTYSLPKVYFPSDDPTPITHFAHPASFPSDNHYSVLRMYIFVCLVCSLFFVCLLVFKYKSEIMWYMYFSIWLILLSIKWSSSIHVVANGKVTSFFFFIAEQYSIIFIYHIFFILLLMGTSLDLYLGYLNNAEEHEGTDIFSD